ncbi:DUF3883 domain-containing protein [Terasakiella sp. A23]|uniref:protein NO VEIN domain-containing protein n=1 Tax=Terasakiella sp. FCG-A23 TaxID=3080561 RepID=UPI00295326E0|nr:DUF3883 domain-containing protein [Terasakiella sp. A23]MDV7341582.1 DUF3883 domain-containing protein [Terasakiella sp. A23]
MSSQKMVLFRLQWMEDYKGFENIKNATFGHVKEGEDPHEAFNFQVESDNCHYGYARISKGDSIHIERLGEVDQDQDGNEYVDGVTVIWTAKHPSGGMVVVGWYKNARVYRQEQLCPDEIVRPFNDDACYRVSANSGDAFFLETEQRDIELLKGLGDTWKQARPFYITEKEEFSEMEKKLWRLVYGKSGFSVSKKRKKPVINQERKKEIEEGAIKLVTDEFENCGYTVTSFEDKNVGYDLQAVSQNGQEILCIEVKGRGIDVVTADFTFNEYETIIKHQNNQFNVGEYVICIVTNVCRPEMKLYQFYYDRKHKGWFDTNNGLKLKPEERVAVKYTAKRGRK